MLSSWSFCLLRDDARECNTTENFIGRMNAVPVLPHSFFLEVAYP